MRRSVLTLAVVLSSVMTLAWRPASGATITVNSLSDPGSAGICTLRDAVQAANTDTAVNGCTAGSGDDTIDLTGVTGTVTLTGGDLATSSNITINGPGASLLAIDGNHLSGVFDVTAGALTLTNLTIQNGTALGGGGIFIDSGATAIATNCTLNGNSSSVGVGGGIYNRGTATLTNCTLTGNSTGPGGSGGGIFSKGTVTLTNCTLSGNSAATGGGIYNGGTATLANTIVANSPSGGDCENSGIVTDNGHNLIQDAANTCGLTNGTNGDIVGFDPVLGPLADYGGPTQTLALLTGSPAIDAGDPIVCAAPAVNNVDQRGAPRAFPGDPICDIGAYEFGALLPLGDACSLSTQCASGLCLRGVCTPPSGAAPALSPLMLVALIGILLTAGLAGLRSERSAATKAEVAEHTHCR